RNSFTCQIADCGPHGSSRRFTPPHHEDLVFTACIDLILTSRAAASRRMGHEHTPPHPRDALRIRVLQTSRVPQQRAQGKPGVRCTRSLACKMKKHTSKSPQVHRTRSGFPCAMVLRLIPRSLRRSGLLSPSPLRSDSFLRSSRQRRGAKTTRLCRPLRCASSLRTESVHRIPRPTSVTIAIRPSCGSWDARRTSDDLPDGVSEIFLRKGVDSRLGLDRTGEIRFLAQWI